MCCNGKKWVLQKDSLKIFEVILTPTSSIATYFMSVVFPGTKNRAQKMTSKHWNACFYTGEQTTNPPDPSEKTALIACAAFSISLNVLKPRNVVYLSAMLPLLLQKPTFPPCQPFPWWEGEPSPSSVGCLGLSQQVLAVHTLEEWRCLCPQPRHRDVVLLPRGQEHRALTSCQ